MRAMMAVFASVLMLVAGPALAQADMALGPATAKVTVIEYASFSCPHCAHFNNSEFPGFKAKYIDTGKVRFVFREFLTDPIQVAGAGALIARCAGPDRYFAVADAFFRGQAQMYATGKAKGLFVAAGKAGGLSETKVEACITDEAQIDALNSRIESYAQQDDVRGTPTFIINGTKFSGEPTLAGLSAAIDPLLGAPAR